MICIRRWKVSSAKISAPRFCEDKTCPRFRECWCWCFRKNTQTVVAGQVIKRDNGASYQLSHDIDDGCVIYLNGVEIYRFGFNVGVTVSYASLASST